MWSITLVVQIETVRLFVWSTDCRCTKNCHILEMAKPELQRQLVYRFRLNKVALPHLSALTKLSGGYPDVAIIVDSVCLTGSRTVESSILSILEIIQDASRRAFRIFGIKTYGDDHTTI